MQEYKLEDIAPCGIPLAVQIMDCPNYQSCHCHNAIEMVYIRHGAGWCAVNGTVYPMLSGDLYIIPVGATHEFYSDANTGFSYINCLFNLSFFRPEEDEMRLFFAGTNAIPDKYTFGPEIQKKLNELFSVLAGELYSSKPFHFIRSRSLFMEILITVMRNTEHSPGIRATHAQKHLGRVLSHIADNLDKKLSLETLAGLSGYTPDYFGKLFSREIGIGLREYIRSRRIERACWLLTDTGKTVEEIAAETGFSDTSFFIKNFKKATLFTPLQFRKKAWAGSCGQNREDFTK